MVVLSMLLAVRGDGRFRRAAARGSVAGADEDGGAAMALAYADSELTFEQCDLLGAEEADLGGAGALSVRFCVTSSATAMFGAVGVPR